MESSVAAARPSLLDDKNYAYWKIRVKAYIKAIDERSWKSVVTGWTPPTVTTDEVTTVKSEETWTKEENSLATANFKALNAIFASVDSTQFKLISACESAKDAWSILQTAHEGTPLVKISKLQMLASKFEDLKMLEHETISDFNSKLCDIANEAFALGEKYSDTKLVRKTLRSLPERFAYKVAAIEEARDVQNMRLDELMGSLHTFELNLKMNKKEKSIAFQADHHEYSDEGNDSDDNDESLVLLTKNFNRFLKKMNRKKNPPNSKRFNNFQRNKKSTNTVEIKNQSKGIQCRECEGFGHIQSECANTLKKKGKSLKTTWSDSDSDDTEDDNFNSNYVGFQVTTKKGYTCCCYN